jgi:uncharacterized iron-regulated protein
MPTPATASALPHRRALELRLGHSLALFAFFSLLALALVQTGCAGAGGPPTGAATAAAWRAPPGQALLLGEVHDNAAQHALRARGLAALLAQGDRPALLMEQFDRERQPAMDALRAGGAIPPAAALEAQVDALVQLGGTGWDWPLYKPYLRLALAHGLPLLAANVSRTEARQVMQQGLAAGGWQAAVPDDIRQAHTQAIVDSHCGQLDAAGAARLALAQVARDQFMARLVAQQLAGGAVLLAGNGHVRTDIGVPRWLAPAVRARTRVVGALEAGDAGSQAFDSVLTTPAQTRPDPCAGLRMPAGPTSSRPASINAATGGSGTTDTSKPQLRPS